MSSSSSVGSDTRPVGTSSVHCTEMNSATSPSPAADESNNSGRNSNDSDSKRLVKYTSRRRCSFLCDDVIKNGVVRGLIFRNDEMIAHEQQTNQLPQVSNMM
jgi:hypothetical protein